MNFCALSSAFKSFALVAICLLFGLVLTSCSLETGLPWSSLSASGRPNIVFILTDDLDAGSISSMPELESLLAEQGTTFEKAFVTHSLCCPSRASILLGRYTHNHGVLTNNNASDGGFEKFRSEGHEESTIATWLRSGGYQTVLFGKYLNEYPSAGDETHVPPGWDEWYALLGRVAYYDYQLNENGGVVSYGDDEQDYFTDVLARKAQDYIRRKAGDEQPFFMYVATGAPHEPYTGAQRHKHEFEGSEAPRPPSFDEEDISDKPSWIRDRARPFHPELVKRIDNIYRNRLRTLLAVDEMLSGIVEELEASGELENTYIVFGSDNGYHLGEHRIDTGKRTAYEEAIRVPLIVRGPGVPAGRTSEQLVLNIDLAPTFAELAGVPAPPTVDGRSLVPLLAGDPAPAVWRSGFLAEHWTGGWGYPPTPTYKAARTEEHKYVEYGSEERELYDLRADPYELENFYESADPALKERLEARLAALRECAGEGCRVAEDGP